MLSDQVNPTSPTLHTEAKSYGIIYHETSLMSWLVDFVFQCPMDEMDYSLKTEPRCEQIILLSSHFDKSVLFVF